MTTTGRILVVGVLAGAYRGRDIGARALLTHAWVPGAPRSLCRRVPADHLADESVGGAPTCTLCLRRLASANKEVIARFQRASDEVPVDDEDAAEILAGVGIDIGEAFKKTQAHIALVDARLKKERGSIGPGGVGPAKKGAPLRRVVAIRCPSTGLFDAALVELECGHTARAWGGLRVRCPDCKGEPK